MFNSQQPQLRTSLSLICLKKEKNDQEMGAGNSRRVVVDERKWGRESKGGLEKHARWHVACRMCARLLACSLSLPPLSHTQSRRPGSDEGERRKTQSSMPGWCRRCKNCLTLPSASPHSSPPPSELPAPSYFVADSPRVWCAPGPGRRLLSAPGPDGLPRIASLRICRTIAHDVPPRKN